MKPKLFKDLLASVKQAQAIERGAMKPARVSTSPAKGQMLNRSGRTLAKTEPKNAAAVTLGRMGGLKGGKARAKALTAKQRTQIAKKAAVARWKRKPAEKS